MAVWQVVLFANLMLAVGFGLGYAGWGRRADVLDQQLEASRARLEVLERQRQACASGARTGEQQWEGRGIVRAIFPEAQLFVITHEEIQGLLPARTTSFRVAAARRIRESVQMGDAIRFSLRGTDRDDAAVVAIERW